MKRAVIIGATSGIGHEVARLLWKDGWMLGIAGRREDRLDAFVEKCDERVVAMRIDVTALDADSRMLELIARLGGVDLVFFSAGIGAQNRGLVPETELHTVQTNAYGFVRIVVAAFNYFKAKGGGHIAIISSIAGTKGLGAAPAYSATKRMQNTYIEALSQLSNMERANVIFTDIRPGFVDTDLLKSGHYPMLLRPEKVAKKIVRALKRRRKVVVIDWKYRLLVMLWKMIPRWFWVRMRVHN